MSLSAFSPRLQVRRRASVRLRPQAEVSRCLGAPALLLLVTTIAAELKRPGSIFDDRFIFNWWGDDAKLFFALVVLRGGR